MAKKGFMLISGAYFASVVSQTEDNKEETWITTPKVRKLS